MGGPQRVFVGQSYGRLVIVHRSADGTVVCFCDCGERVERKSSDIVRPATASCGCYPRERMTKRNLIHGATTGGHISAEWQSWRSMHQRCNDPKHRSYARYGGRGITVCVEWMTFSRFLADMGPRPHGMTLEREKNDEGYSKDNCVWATRSTQAKNRRPRERRSDGTFAGAAA